MNQAIARTEYDFSGVRMLCMLTGEETRGTHSLLCIQSDGNSGTPVHIHQREDETLIVVEGEMQAIVDGQPQTLHAGQAAFLPRYVPHQIKNVSGAPSRYMLLCTPGGFENFIASAGQPMSGERPAHKPSEADIELMKKLAPRFGITLLPRFAAGATL